MRIGYFLSCEEYTPAELIEQAKLAEEAGFQGLWISDHYHPWNDEQGQSDKQRAMLDTYEQAGFDEVYVSNIGPNYRELIDLYRREFLR